MKNATLSHNQPTENLSLPFDLGLPDAELEYYPTFIAHDVAWDYYQRLISATHWRQDVVQVYGKKHLTPRLSSWVGDPGTQYSYSNLMMHPAPWTKLLLELKALVQDVAESEFNSVLLNYYRDGRDSNGWHSDDEPELGKNPVIASLSLGSTRDFHLRHKTKRHLKHKIKLSAGSLLVMQGTTQCCWQHHVPKRVKAEPRLNLTFRTILQPSF